MRLRSSRTIVLNSSSVSRRNDCRRFSSKFLASRLDVIELAQVEPLAGEVLDEGVCLRVREHALDLLIEHLRIAQPSFGRNVEQFIVGNAAPQEERQTRRKIDVADAIRLTGGDRRWFFLGAIDEAWRDQHARQLLPGHPTRSRRPPVPSGRTPSTYRSRWRSPVRDTHVVPSSSDSNARRSFHRRPTSDDT